MASHLCSNSSSGLQGPTEGNADRALTVSEAQTPRRSHWGAANLRSLLAPRHPTDCTPSLALLPKQTVASTRSPPTSRGAACPRSAPAPGLCSKGRTASPHKPGLSAQHSGPRAGHLGWPRAGPGSPVTPAQPAGPGITPGHLAAPRTPAGGPSSAWKGPVHHPRRPQASLLHRRELRGLCHGAGGADRTRAASTWWAWRAWRLGWAGLWRALQTLSR